VQDPVGTASSCTWLSGVLIPRNRLALLGISGTVALRPTARPSFEGSLARRPCGSVINGCRTFAFPGFAFAYFAQQLDCVNHC